MPTPRALATPPDVRARKRPCARLTTIGRAVGSGKRFAEERGDVQLYPFRFRVVPHGFSGFRVDWSMDAPLWHAQEGVVFHQQ